ncbi:MAG: hypothetical protein HOI95_06275 [Chromatiales bacterium]|jgi:alpha-ketoglutarate-dependent taurine dioxygenase|nr:hypothetical protein [Chromatiales bacterium]
MKTMIAPLKVHMSAHAVLRNRRSRDGEQQTMNAVAEELSEEEMMIRGSLHPLIHTYPVTGAKSLYVDQSYSVGIDGMKKREARALIAFLAEHVTQPEFTCRVRWAPNTMVMWGNRATLHHAFNDYDGYRREMYRTTIQGEAPA